MGHAIETDPSPPPPFRPWYPRVAGKKIKTYQELLDASALDHAIIVGCGEKFDRARPDVSAMRWVRVHE